MEFNNSFTVKEAKPITGFDLHDTIVHLNLPENYMQLWLSLVHKVEFYRTLPKEKRDDDKYMVIFEHLR